LGKNRKSLAKMMTEFSQELGITGQKKNNMATKMLVAAGSAAGLYLIRQLYNRMK